MIQYNVKSKICKYQLEVTNDKLQKSKISLKSEYVVGQVCI